MFHGFNAVAFAKTAELKERLYFEEVGESVILFEQRLRRKWDSAVIADLDKDGYEDLLTTEHGNMVKLYWNNGGSFSKPVKVIGGDSHGIAVGDYDDDGYIELIISMGGGGGKKPRYPRIFEVRADRSIHGGVEFPIHQRSRGRAVKLLDSDQDGDLDVVFSAFPLLSQPQGANYLYRNENGKLLFQDVLPQAKWLGYKTTIVDFNADNDPDMFFHGGDNIVAVQGGKKTQFYNQTKEVLGPLTDTTHVSSMTEIDFDNDGDMDLLLTRARHQFYEERYYDALNERFAFFVRRQSFQFDDLKVRGNFRLENLQMAYPHYDVFVGKEKRLLSFDVDKHGDKNLILSPEEAGGWPEERGQKGLYIGYLGNGYWRVGGETESPTAGVVHNVISVPSVTEPVLLPAKFLENKNGKFVDITKQSQIDIPEQTTSAVAGDFNNDGWQDLVILKVGDMSKVNKPILYLNEKGKRFSLQKEHGIETSELGVTGGSIEAFDYDSDGDLDLIYSNERGLWHLFKNQFTSSQNNYVSLIVGESPKHHGTEMGAKVTLSACGKSMQRVVGSTSSAFSHSIKNHLHFGLGNCKQADKTVVSWTNGETRIINMGELNRRYKTVQSNK